MSQDPARQTDGESTPLPWFRYGMVWMVILLPFVAVVASLITVVIAHRHAPTLIDNSTTNSAQVIEQPYGEAARP